MWHEKWGNVSIYNKYTNTTIKKNIIKNNRSEDGGGVYLLYSSADLIGNTIRNNHAYKSGGGIVVGSSNVEFDDQILNNVYLNFARKGADIAKADNCPPIEVIVDTFTVAEPDFFFLHSTDGGFYVENDFSYSFQNAKIEQVEHDLYVSATGDDNNSGLSASEPLQNIHYAITLIKADSLNPRTIFVADGLYSADLNNQYFPLHMKSDISLVGESMSNTILDSEVGHIYASDNVEAENVFLQTDWSLKNFKMINSNDDATSCLVQRNHNVYFENIEITDGFSAALIRVYLTKINMNNIYIHDSIDCAAVWFYGSRGYDVTFSNIKINNIAPLGQNQTGCAGLTILKNPSSQPDHTVNIINAELTNNEVILYDWPNVASVINASDFSNVNLINSTITQNQGNAGAAVKVSYESEMNIYNSILYGNEPREICLDGSNGHVNTLNVYNTLLDGGGYNILSIGYNEIYLDEATNLDEDPLFSGEGDYPFALSELSPCIDAGTMELPEGVILPDYDLAGNPRVCGSSVDMGAYEWQDIVAPINVAADSMSGILSWAIPAGNIPTAYNLYLDGDFVESVDNNTQEYTFVHLMINHEYSAGVSAIYNQEETPIIWRDFVYQPVSINNEELIISNNDLTNYPNPFNPSTTISFALGETAKHAEVEVYNIKGQLVKTLMDAQVSPGEYNIIWQGTDNNNKRVASGTYFVKLAVNGIETSNAKITLLK